ncbi:MAG: hypothetical protein QOK35_396 [Pseudonocardiales bacterium]|nr:hypothetical protein [Pseudonocardiales bacterium]
MTLPPPRPADPRTLRGPGPGEVADPDLDDAAGQDRTGAVERALAELDGLAARPLAEHVAVFERIHTALQDALA